MNDEELGTAVRKLLTAWLIWHDLVDRAERHAEIETRVEGYRVVTGGQTGSDGSWEITDAETGEMLAQGVGFDSFEAAWQEGWYHEDVISDEAFEETIEPRGDCGLPAGFAETLRAWAIDRPQEAREVVSDPQQ